MTKYRNNNIKDPRPVALFELPHGYPKMSGDKRFPGGR